MTTPFVPPTSRRVQSISPSATKEMPIIAARVGGCVSLGQGVPSFATPEHVAEAVVKALRDDPASGKYTLQPGLPSLRAALTDLIEREKGLRFDPALEIGVSVGAMEALACAFLTLVDEGDEVITPSPAYGSHIEQILLAGGKPVFVELDGNDGWSLDVDKVKAAVTDRTKALILCNPSNPTGGVVSDEAVRELCALALEKNFVIVSDETYDYITYNRPAPLSPASVDGMREHVVLVNSFSKRYALTGWRVGYFAASEPLMTQMLKVHDATAICAPAVSQIAALAALTGPQAPFLDMAETLKSRRDLCARRLRELPEHFAFAEPAGAFYVLARCLFAHENSRQAAIRLVEEAKVITVPGGSFGPGGEHHLRLSFGCDESELNEAFDRIEAWAQTL